MQKYIFQEGNVPDGQKDTYNSRDLFDVVGGKSFAIFFCFCAGFG
jgi:hypothetical protein